MVLQYTTRFGRGIEQVQIGQVNPDHLSGHFRGALPWMWDVTWELSWTVFAGLQSQPSRAPLWRLSWAHSWTHSWGHFQTAISTHHLSGPLDRLNAILSLLQPLDRYRALSAIGSAIGRPLSRPISHPRTGRSPQPPRSKPLRGLNRAIVVL